MQSLELIPEILDKLKKGVRRMRMKKIMLLLLIGVLFVVFTSPALAIPGGCNNGCSRCVYIPANGHYCQRVFEEIAYCQCTNRPHGAPCALWTPFCEEIWVR